jgi:hypothetical protein
MTDQPTPKIPQTSHPRIILNELEKDLALPPKATQPGCSQAAAQGEVPKDKNSPQLPEAMKLLDEVLKEIQDERR